MTVSSTEEYRTNMKVSYCKNWKRSHSHKCSVIRISRSRKTSPMSYTLMVTFCRTKTIQNTMYLNLLWNFSQISHGTALYKTVKKANSMLGFLRRNMRVSNKSTKTSAYMLEYCSKLWSPYTYVHIKKVIEMVQCRAARYVTNR